jgi:carbonic anhydrase/acetyltransferase-like protein (isoleucine patch superfamily)
MGATVMNGAVIGRNCIVGRPCAGGGGQGDCRQFDGAGAPGRVVKTVDEQGEEMLRKAARAYVDKVHRYAKQQGLKLIEL